ncbi:cohesin loading factor-domain-containing protein [Phaeosphaeria sp. MPI-PUGE-AT-0046c]|nr:cohesin loading factor-domain-containing protein [Phaeosphaeria sp. MPI-PUGE-AT-0046c]
MDPRNNHNWPPQQYANGQYAPYPPQQQPNGHQYPNYAPPYNPMQAQISQGYMPPQPSQGYAHNTASRPPSQQYPPTAQAYPQYQQARPQPQVMIPPRNPNPSYVSPMQHMQAPKIRHVQMPVQRTSGSGIAQTDGSHDRRPSSTQQVPTPPQSKQVQRSQSHQENRPHPPQQTPKATSQHQHRAPLQQQQRQQQQSTPQQRALPADLSVMLLSAADEYIAAARSMTTLIVRHRRQADIDYRHKLMATGLGCMDTVMRDFNLLPRDEAKLRLTYASLLVAETDNPTDIDDVLAKQIALCGRCRLQDLKYASLHLQARYQFKSNPRAALKSLDKSISEAETFQHTAWVYAFRFLKVSLALQVPGRVETVQALQQLHAILPHAERRGDRAVYVACNVLEAMVHLRSSAPDRLEQAQRAIAAARSLQLQLSAEQLSSFGTLLEIMDVVCGIHNGQPDLTKSTALISGVIDEKTNSRHSKTGNITVVLERSSGGPMTADTGGIFKKNADGRDELAFAWLSKDDLQILCLYVCAFDQHVHERGFKYVKEAHQRAKGMVRRSIPPSIPIYVAVAQTEWINLLDWHALFAIGLMACFREEQAVGVEALAILQKRAAKLLPSKNEMYARSLSYLSAVIDQRNGHFDPALRAYSSPMFQLPGPGSPASAKLDFSILAALNTLFIVRFPGHPQQATTTALLMQLKSLCENHFNQYIQTAYCLVYAMSSPDTSTEASIYRKKTTVQDAINKANGIVKRTKNYEFVKIGLPYFSESFFVSQVNEKAIQAVRATRLNTSRGCPRPLWIAVAAGMCMQTFQNNGLIEEAQEARREYEGVVHLLPAPLTDGGSDEDAEGEEDDE